MATNKSTTSITLTAEQQEEVRVHLHAAFSAAWRVTAATNLLKNADTENHEEIALLIDAISEASSVNGGIIEDLVEALHIDINTPKRNKNDGECELPSGSTLTAILADRYLLAYEKARQKFA